MHTLSRFLPCIVLGLLLLIINRDEISISNYHRDSIRIVSLSPSITAQIVDLNKEELLVGVTSFHPLLKRKVDIIGTLINPNIEAIIRSNPSLILYSKEDAVVQKVNRLKSLGARVIAFEINRSFKDVCRNYLQLGEAAGATAEARAKLEYYQKRYEVYRTRSRMLNKIPAVFLVSDDPLITVSRDSYIHEILELAGFRNVFANLSLRYAPVSFESLLRRKPHVFISLGEKGSSHFQHKMKNIQLYKNKKGLHFFDINYDNIAFYSPGHFIASVEELYQLRKGIIGK